MLLIAYFPIPIHLSLIYSACPPVPLSLFLVCLFSNLLILILFVSLFIHLSTLILILQFFDYITLTSFYCFFSFSSLSPSFFYPDLISFLPHFPAKFSNAFLDVFKGAPPFL